MNDTPTAIDAESLRAAGFSDSDVTGWQGARPKNVASYAEDRRRYSDFWMRSKALLTKLPAKPRRTPAEQASAEIILSAARKAREAFLGAHTIPLYYELTHKRENFLRLDALCFAAADILPGLAPTRKDLAQEVSQKQGDKDGLEIDQGIFLAHVLADETSGNHLCHAMLLPKPESVEALARFTADGELDLGPVRLTRSGKAVHVTSNTPRFLNAEDNDTLALTEVAIDVAIARSKKHDRRASRRRRRAPKISRAKGFWRRHQPDPALSRRDSVPLVPRARHGLRPQAFSRCRFSRPDCPTTSTVARPKNFGSLQSTPSRSAATASCFSRWITCLRRATPT